MNLQTIVSAALVALFSLGAWMVSGGDRTDTPAGHEVQATTSAEISRVVGRQEPQPADPVLETGKCCAPGELCTPEAPTVEGGVSCTASSSGGCTNATEGKPCYAWSGDPVKNGKCVTPPPGFSGQAWCAMDGGSYPCRKFRTGECDSTGLFGGGSCVCDTDSAEVWANGARRCAQGSTTCTRSTVGVVPSGQ